MGKNRLQESIKISILKDLHLKNASFLSNIGTPSNVYIRRIEGKGLEFEFFDNMNEALELNNVKKGLSDFLGSFSGIDFRDIPKLTPNNMEYKLAHSFPEVSDPKLPSLPKNNCVVIRVVKNAFNSYEGIVDLEFPGYNHASKFLYKESTLVQSGRTYELLWDQVKEESKIGDECYIRNLDRMEFYKVDFIDSDKGAFVEVERFPIVLPMEFPGELEKIFCFFCDVLRNQLEPLTLDRLIDRIRGLKDFMNDDKTLVAAKQKIYEKKLLAMAITMDFFIKYRDLNDTTFNKDSVYNIQDRDLLERDVGDALKSLQKYKVQGTIDLYSSPEWDLQTFLLRRY